MGKFNSMNEVLDFAIDREIEANRLYSALAAQTKKPVMRKVFEDFAKEELGHKAKLEAMKMDETTGSAPKAPDLTTADYVVTGQLNPNMDYRMHLYSRCKRRRRRSIFTSISHEKLKTRSTETYFFRWPRRKPGTSSGLKSNMMMLF